MANPADDGRSISSRNVPISPMISVASSSNISNTSTLPRITELGMTTSYFQYIKSYMKEYFYYMEDGLDEQLWRQLEERDGKLTETDDYITALGERDDTKMKTIYY
eukprot:6122741-Amphidinium_carterae.1